MCYSVQAGQPRLHFIVPRLTPRPFAGKLIPLVFRGPTGYLEHLRLWGGGGPSIVCVHNPDLSRHSTDGVPSCLPQNKAYIDSLPRCLTYLSTWSVNEPGPPM